MMNKLKSNKGSTLTIAIIIMITLSSIALLTTLIIARSSKSSLDRVDNKLEVVKLESTMYDALNYLALNNDNLASSNLKFRTEGNNIIIDNENYLYTLDIVNEESSYFLTLKYKKLSLEARVVFNFIDKAYEIKSWSL